MGGGGGQNHRGSYKQILRIFGSISDIFTYISMFFRACRHHSTKSAKWGGGHLIPFAPPPCLQVGGNCPLCPQLRCLCVLPCRIWSFCGKRCRHKYRTPKSGNAASLLSWVWEAGLTPSYTLPDLCYHVKFGSSAAKDVHINIMERPKLWRAGSPAPCGRGVADQNRLCPSPTFVSGREFGPSMSNATNVKIRLKNLILNLPPFKVRP